MLGAQSTSLTEVPSGYAGTREVVKFLAEVARARHLDPSMRDRYAEITTGVDPMDYDGEIRAVWNFILSNIRYQRDPLGAEHITDPLELDRRIDMGLASEDCESIALYAATLFAAGGLPSEFEIQGRDPTRPERFTHCSLQVKNPRTKQWTSFDPIGAFAFPGAFDLGDTLHRVGQPIERWSLDGERSQMLSDYLGDVELTDSFLGAAFGDVDSTAATEGAIKSVGDAIASIYGAVASGQKKPDDPKSSIKVTDEKKKADDAKKAAASGGSFLGQIPKPALYIGGGLLALLVAKKVMRR